MSIYRVILGISTLIYASFIVNYPPSFYNDDSYFFVQGIEHFSVIDFAPHFPGYPSVILLGKLINFFLEDATLSFFILSSFCAVLLPWVIFEYISKMKNEKIAFLAAIFTISSPYLMNLSLSMLSDSIGLFFLFLSLNILERNYYKATGILVALSFFARPSYFVIYLAGLVYLKLYKQEAVKPVFIYFCLTSIFFIVFLLSNDGFLYIKEAFRFIVGHFQLWGTGQNSDVTWWDKLFIIENLPYILLIGIIFKFDKKYSLLYFIFFFYFIWIIFAQNPDNTRHLIPLIIIANILLAAIVQQQTSLIIIIIVSHLFFLSSYQEKSSPIDQIAKKIQHTNRIIISNRSIEILRNIYHFQVADNYYQASSKYLIDNKPTYIITTKVPKNRSYLTFKGRFIGESNYYLIEK